MEPHFANPSKGHLPLCGEEGKVVFNIRRVRCTECIVLLRRQRRARLKQQADETEFKRKEKKRQLKIQHRINRRLETRHAP